MNNSKKIIDLLLRKPGLDDDEISRQADITPRQQVNQICRRLESKGFLVRKVGSTGKIINFLADNQYSLSSLGTFKKTEAVGPLAKIAPKTSATSVSNAKSFIPGNLEDTLFVIQCSGKKTYNSAHLEHNSSIVDSLPNDIQSRMLNARCALRDQIAFDESHLMPAWQRYDGYFYQESRGALEASIAKKLNVLILSGGYGVILATEAIGLYQQRLKLSMWPKGLLQSVLQSYARVKKLKSMRALVSSSTDYCKLVKSTDWHEVGIHDALIITPKVEGGGAMRKGPRAQGEAFAALLKGDLHTGWISTDKTRLEAQQL